MIRIDKFFSETGTLSRTETAKAIKFGQIFVDGEKVKTSDIKIDEKKAVVTYLGQVVNYQKYVYIMLNKPQGVISATEDKSQKTVLDLLPDKYKKMNLFPCGRLDKDTLGLVILTNDGESGHKALAPKSHVKKTYLFECADNLSSADVVKIEQGVLLKDGYLTKPCEIEMINCKKGKITLTEGKYHEIKRMLGAVGNKITYLERISFGGIILDSSLKRGEWRELNCQEINIFCKK